MAAKSCSDTPEEQLTNQQKPLEDCDSSDQQEFDFVERPSEDFFCPVTFELLLEPHQTTCCGNHLSKKVVSRLQRDGKPCPVCKEPQLNTVPDKFHRRRVSAVHIRCPHKTSGCEWVGEVGVVNQHTDSCPKRPWKCQYCEFTSTSDVGNEHIEQCTKYPTPCPNKCEVRTVPRCDIEKHRVECLLEPVECEFADVGCNVKVARRDLSHHLEESQQQHQLAATLCNLRLTRAAIAEKDRQLAEKDRQLAEKDCQLVEKDKLIKGVVDEKDNRMAEKDAVIAKKDKEIAEKDKQLSELRTELQQFQEGFMKSAKVALDNFLWLHAQRFVLRNFSECQKKGLHGDWFSQPFYSHPGGYYLKLNVETREISPDMKVRLYPVKTDYVLDWPVTFIVTLQLLNQLGDHTHYTMELEIKLESLIGYSAPHEYVSFVTLYRKDSSVQYLVEDCLILLMWIKIK